MSVKRLVVVSDRYDLEQLVRALMSVGVDPGDIHISEDIATTTLRQRGLIFDIPPGPIYIGPRKFYPSDDVP